MNFSVYLHCLVIILIVFDCKGYLLEELEPKIECGKCQCGKSSTITRIVGGQETKVNAYPWMTALLIGDNLICGGSLINDLYILTAAHCTVYKGINVKLMVHNINERNTRVIKRKIIHMKVHENYNINTVDNDIALLKMDERVEINNLLIPVCLPVEDESFVNFTGLITGWGNTHQGGQMSSVLLEAKVPIISNKKCAEYYSRFVKITENMMCAGYEKGGVDSCQGDSGGPLHVKNTTTNNYEIAGIVSFGVGCAKPYLPGVYTRVNRYNKWIRDNTADACYC